MTQEINLNVGSQFWINDIIHGLSKVVVVEELSGEIQKFKAYVSEGPKAGRVIDLFPGDMGLIGHAYDDRPCIAGLTKESVMGKDNEYLAWLGKSYYNNNPWMVIAK